VKDIPRVGTRATRGLQLQAVSEMGDQDAKQSTKHHDSRPRGPKRELRGMGGKAKLGLFRMLFPVPSGAKHAE